MRRPMTAVPAGLLAAVLVLAGCSSSEKPGSDRLDGVKKIAVKHGHKEGHITYDGAPPAGGVHNPRWLRCDVYTAAVPNESAVHSLEHGAVWVTYREPLPAADVAKLADLATINADYTLVSPYPGQPAPVMATTWGLQLSVESADDARLAEFVKAYAGGGQGDEPGAPCRSGGVTPEQAQQLVDNPSSG